MTGAQESPWFLTRDGAADAPARIFCFPYAGGAPRLFLAWQPDLAGDAQILAVCRPGRDHRSAEPAPTFDEYADGAATAIRAAAEEDGRPVYLFGHSLGALVAFEVARRLADLPAVRHLVASGVSAPSLLPSPRVRHIADLEGEEFARQIAFFGGLAPDVVADPDLRDLLLPLIVADFRIAVGYRYRAAAPLAIPVSLVNGDGDPHVGRDEIAPWHRETLAPPAEHWTAGGHFYFEDDPAAATGLLRDVVQADQHVELI
jgi:surfactin synthase thioesterase subunit